MFLFDLTEKNAQNKFFLMHFTIFTRSEISTMETYKRVPSPLCTSFLQSSLTWLLLLFMAFVRVTTCPPEKRCHGLNICVSPKLLWWMLNDSSDSVRSWDLEWCLGHEGGAFTNGINACIKEALGAPSSLSSIWAHSERYTPWKRALTWLWWHPDLRVPGPRIGGGKFLLFFSCPLCDFFLLLLQQLKWTNTMDKAPTNQQLAWCWALMHLTNSNKHSANSVMYGDIWDNVTKILKSYSGKMETCILLLSVNRRESA